MNLRKIRDTSISSVPKVKVGLQVSSNLTKIDFFFPEFINSNHTDILIYIYNPKKY
jgi:hypothetical protein